MLLFNSRFILCAAALWAAVTACMAQSESEGYSSNYLNRIVGARALGLAGAYTAAANEPNAIFCNPAALQTVSEDYVLSSMLSVLSFNRYQSTLAASKNVSADFSIAVAFNLMSDPAFMRRDRMGVDLGMTTFQQYSMSVGAAYNTGPATFGGTFKYLRSTLSAEGLLGSGVAFDVGSKFPLTKMFSFGASVQNIGSMTWNTSSKLQETLPWMLRGGLSSEIPLSKEEYVVRSTSLGVADTLTTPATRYILLCLEANYIRGASSPLVSFGCEYSATEVFAIRAGLAVVGDVFGSASLFPLSRYSGGMSYRINSPDLPMQVQIDYAASHDFTSQAGITHHFSLTVGL